MSSRRDRMLLILDLDETLVHASSTPLDRAADFRVAHYHVYRRPHLDDFLTAVSTMYDLAVWSSASDDYVKAVVANIFPKLDALQFVWGRSRATYRHIAYTDDFTANAYDPEHFFYIKDLSKVRRLGWPLERVLIVDDTPEKCIRNYGNAIYPTPYEGSLQDEELPHLASYLETLRDVHNVRKIEKRRWRTSVQAPIKGDNPTS